MCSRYVCTSPGPPPRRGGGPLVRKNFGSLTGDMNSSGCPARAACSAVVPALGAPITRKSGRATVVTSSPRSRYPSISINLVVLYPGGQPSSRGRTLVARPAAPVPCARCSLPIPARGTPGRGPILRWAEGVFMTMAGGRASPVPRPAGTPGRVPRLHRLGGLGRRLGGGQRYGLLGAGQVRPLHPDRDQRDQEPEQRDPGRHQEPAGEAERQRMVVDGCRKVAARRRVKRLSRLGGSRCCGADLGVDAV